MSECFLPTVNGVTNSVLRVIEHLRRGGHQVLVVAPGGGTGEDDDYQGVPVVRVPALELPVVNSMPVGLPSRKVLTALRRFRPDVVHLAAPFVVGARGLAAARRLAVPTVAVYQTDVAGFAASYGLGVTARAAWRWTCRLHNLADRTLAPSSWATEALRSRGVPRVHRWGRGVDISRFRPSRRASDRRAELIAGELAALAGGAAGLTGGLAGLAGRPAGLAGGGALAGAGLVGGGELLVGYVGRLAPEKQVERLTALGGVPGVKLVVVGEGPSEARLRELLPAAGVDVRFLGFRGGDELADIYAALDVFVHTGPSETFCQTVQEALASGVPVVALDAGGPKDLVLSGRTGYLVPQGRDVADPDASAALRAAVLALADPDVRHRAGLAARRSVLRRDWSTVCDELLAHYGEVIAEARYRGEGSSVATARTEVITAPDRAA